MRRKGGGGDPTTRMTSSSSEDFFTSFDSSSSMRSNNTTNAPPPPPPPPRSTPAAIPTTTTTAAATTSSSSYYGGNNGAPSSTSSYYGNNPSSNPYSGSGYGNNSGNQGQSPGEEDWFANSTTNNNTALPYNNAAINHQQHQHQQQSGSSNPFAYSQSSSASSSSPSFYGGTSSFSSTADSTPSQEHAHLSGPMGSATSSSGNGSPITNNTRAGSSDYGYSSDPSSSSSSQPMIDPDYENEPPLMEELGINIQHIFIKGRAVLVPFAKFAKTVDPTIINEEDDEADLAGPLVVAMLLGAELLLAGKIHFGYIYGFGTFGWLALSLMINLMCPGGAVSIWTIVSVLGYALLPVNALAAINIFYGIKYMGWFGMILAALTILWSTAASTRLFERGCGLREQRFLVAYPCMLLYSAFVMITIF